MPEHAIANFVVEARSFDPQEQHPYLPPPSVSVQVTSETYPHALEGDNRLLIAILNLCESNNYRIASENNLQKRR